METHFLSPLLSVTPNSLITPRPKEPDGPEALTRAHVLRRKSAKRKLQHDSEIEAAAQEIAELPGPEESIHCVMRANFHGWDLVPAILRLAKPATIAKLHVATLGFNRQNAVELLELLDSGQVQTVVFVCSVYFQKSCPEEFTILNNGLTQRGQTIAALRSHAKVLGIALTDGRRLAVESSANLRSCRNIEQFCLTNSAPLYEFHTHWIDQLTRAAGIAKQTTAWDAANDPPTKPPSKPSRKR